MNIEGELGKEQGMRAGREGKRRINNTEKYSQLEESARDRVSRRGMR